MCTTSGLCCSADLDRCRTQAAAEKPGPWGSAAQTALAETRKSPGKCLPPEAPGCRCDGRALCSGPVESSLRPRQSERGSFCHLSCGRDRGKLAQGCVRFSHVFGGAAVADNIPHTCVVSQPGGQDTETRVWQGRPRRLGVSVPGLCLTPGGAGGLGSLACGSIALVSALVFMWLSPPVCQCPNFPTL